MWMGESPNAHRVLILMREKEKQKVMNSGYMGFQKVLLSTDGKKSERGTGLVRFYGQVRNKKMVFKERLDGSGVSHESFCWTIGSR